MGKAIVTEVPENRHNFKKKSARDYYAAAYADLRYFYRRCHMGILSDAELMAIKYRLWLKHGKYLDIVWQHHFAARVSDATGIGHWHGWHNSQRLHQFAKNWSMFRTRCFIPS